jgi:transposase
MQKTLTMNAIEKERLNILQWIETSNLTYVEAAELMHISERHLYRIVKRYKTESDAGLIHKLRGRTPNRG